MRGLNSKRVRAVVSASRPLAWFAVDCMSHHAPALARLRLQAGSLADCYFYRAYAFAKLHAPQGFLETAWPDLAAWVLWPDSPEELRDLFRATGIVVAPRDRLYLWEETNGWIIRQRAADAQRKRAERMHAQRKAQAARARRTGLRTSSSLLGGGSVGRGTGQNPDVLRTSVGRPTDAKTRKQKGK